MKKNNKEEKQTNILFLFLKMLVLFLIFDTMVTNVPSLIGRYIIAGKYSSYVLVECLALIFALIAMILAGNSYIFKEKKNNILSSLLIGGFPIAISLINFVPNIMPAIKDSIPNVVSLLFYCAAIGLFEEFLCRGWVQTEFIERYAKTFKQACVSIFLSSLIFGFMHLSNIWIGGQSVLETVCQITQATGMGFLLGAIFFRTKNIWSVAFIHGFWDFSLMLEESMSIKECTYNEATKNILIFQTTTTIILAILYFIVGLYVLRKTNNEEYFSNIETNSKKQKNFSSLLILCIIVICVLPIKSPSEDELNNYKTCYEFEEISFDSYEIISQHKNEYNIDLKYEKLIDNDIEISNSYILDEEKINMDVPETLESNISITIKNKDNKLYLIDNITETEYELKYDSIFDYEVIKNNDSYIILIVTRDSNSGESIAYYNDYINVDNLSKDDSIDKIVNSFVELKNIPITRSIGYIHNDEDNYNYPLIISKADNVIIDSNRTVIEFKEK